MTSPDAQDPRLLSEEDLQRIGLYGGHWIPRLIAHIAAQAEIIAAYEEQLAAMFARDRIRALAEKEKREPTILEKLGTLEDRPAVDGVFLRTGRKEKP